MSVVQRCDFFIGDRIDHHFQVQKILGEGSFGKVYAVTDPNGELQALKLLKLWEVPSEIRASLMARFDMEFETGRIDSKYLVHSIAHGTVNGNPYIVMEYCPNGDLLSIVAQQYVDLTKVATHVLYGLKALHSCGKVHRDLKPENVLVKKNGDYASTNEDDYYFNWWGGNLRGVADYPVDLGKYQNKLVYSPHDYGPTVYEQPWFQGSYTYDSLMKDCWHDNWFYIHEDNIAPLLIGEWGGFMTEPNIIWMTYMRELIQKNRLNHTFWCFNANSGDTGGMVLDDFTTWDEEKYAFVKEVLWNNGEKFIGLDHAIPLGINGISLGEYYK